MIRLIGVMLESGPVFNDFIIGVKFYMRVTNVTADKIGDVGFVDSN